MTGGKLRTTHGVASSDGSRDGSRVAIEVREGGASGTLLTDATVTIRGNRTGELTLPWQGVTWGDFRLGSYARENLLWDTGWQLKITRGNDGLDAYLGVPV